MALAFGVLALACILVLGRGVFAQNISVHDHDGHISVDASVGDEHHHDRDRHEHHWLAHVEVDAARGHLNSAMDSLGHAPHDLGGHRTKALNAVRMAMRECDEAIKFANSHER